MTERYTAADFANARFAEHEDGNIAIKWGDNDSAGWETQNMTADNDELANDGWVPVIPARTIHDRDVEALCIDTASYERDDYLDGFIRGFQQAGGTILDDPEPTNTERLVEILNDGGFLGGWASHRNLAEYLNDHGVTAPNAKGN